MISACRAELLDLGIRDAEPRAIRRGDIREDRAAADMTSVGVDHLHGLLPDRPLQDRRAARAQRGLVDVELVGIHRALHDRLAEPV